MEKRKKDVHNYMCASREGQQKALMDNELTGRRENDSLVGVKYIKKSSRQDFRPLLGSGPGDSGVRIRQGKTQRK